ncbi:hypothetical protein N7492_002539 [Penicillium capsulatum]|uniref:Uncharacterized protein n=1 Tax=Penicillium capsulatum TaxID=69766 RepID=A0A9W9IK86_9EURO|nr:hypothetical protein N7492_002539 [Penicillium capsulatum]KAJ6122857.1 hypothetical protein N7512_005322 [Penicillium capsulatum]
MTYNGIRFHVGKSNHPPGYLGCIIQYGLYEVLPPELKRHSGDLHSRLGENLLLAASCSVTGSLTKNWTGVAKIDRVKHLRFLVECLRFDVDRDVQFVICSRDNKITPKEQFNLTLLELLEVAKPSNLNTFRQVLQNAAPRWALLSSRLVSGLSSPPQISSL